MARKVQLPEGITHKTFLKQSKGVFWVGEKETETQTSFKIEDSVVRDWSEFRRRIRNKANDRQLYLHGGWRYPHFSSYDWNSLDRGQNLDSIVYIVHHKNEWFTVDCILLVDLTGNILLNRLDYSNGRGYHKARSILTAIKAVVQKTGPKQTLLFEV